MSNLLTAQFWFNQFPGPLIPSAVKSLLGLIIFFLLAAIVFLFLKLRQGFYRPVWEKLLGFFTSNALIGLILFFFSQQMIPFLSTRIWFAIWGIGLIAWAASIIIYGKKMILKKEQFDREKEFKKYIPK